MDVALTLVEAIRAKKLDQYIRQCEDAGVSACDAEFEAKAKAPNSCVRSGPKK